MKIETSSDLRNWLINIVHFVRDRSKGIGGALVILAAILFLIYFGPEIFGR